MNGTLGEIATLEREIHDCDNLGEIPPIPGDDRRATGGPGADDPAVDDESSVRRIKHLPREVGIMLVSVGTLGLVLPGVMGAPALIAGGLVLWPGTFGGVEEWLRRRNPGLHHRGMKQLGRFLDDLERRYPELTKD
jgi:hypothetical protein